MRAAAGVASALNYLHRRFDQPVFHRDVKASNVLLDARWSAKLADVGVAKLIDPADARTLGASRGNATAFTVTNGMPIGTFEYMCPVYLRTRRYGEQSEAFSLGVLTMELLTGCVNGSQENGVLPVRYVDHGEDLKVRAESDLEDGEWPADVVHRIAKLALECCGTYRDRPSMQVARRELHRIEREFCQTTVEEDLRAQIDHLQQRLAQAEQAREAPGYARTIGEEPRTCQVCLDDGFFAPTDGVLCTNDPPHFTCNTCLSAFAVQFEEQLASTDHLADAADAAQAAANDALVAYLGGGLFCPSRNVHDASQSMCTSEVFSLASLATHLSSDAHEALMIASTHLRTARESRRIYDEARQTVERLVRDMHERVRGGEVEEKAARQLLAQHLRRSMPNARQCGRCGFGPVDHMACFDLRAHHGQVVGRGARINNSCPWCGWFSSNVEDWPPWNGELRDEQATPRPEVAANVTTSHDTEAALEHGLGDEWEEGESEDDIDRLPSELERAYVDMARLEQQVAEDERTIVRLQKELAQARAYIDRLEGERSFPTQSSVVQTPSCSSTQAEPPPRASMTGTCVVQGLRWDVGLRGWRAGVYSGEVDEEGLPSGQGTLREEDGHEYQGEWWRGKPNGRGKRYRKDGTLVYEGECKDGKEHGLGKSYYFYDGTLLYDGEWKDGTWNGLGKYYRRDGTLCYEGEFRDRKYHGRGKEYCRVSGMLKHDGRFEEGRFVG